MSHTGDVEELDAALPLEIAIAAANALARALRQSSMTSTSLEVLRQLLLSSPGKNKFRTSGDVVVGVALRERLTLRGFPLLRVT